MAITGSTDIGNGLLFVTVDEDPLQTAVDVPAGSFVVYGTGIYKKLDDGLSTNVEYVGLNRNGSDFTTFANKSTPSVNDILLIESEADGYLKRYTELINLPLYAVSGGSTTTTSTTSTSYVLMSDMALSSLPPGRYFVSASFSWSQSTNGATAFAAIHDGSGIIQQSETRYLRQNAITIPAQTQSLVLLNSIGTISVYWRVTAGTVTAYVRNITGIKVG